MKDSKVLIKNLMNSDNFIKHEIKLRKFELECYFRALRQKSNVKESNFILLAQWRTGSTLLEKLLDCHPDITSDTEIYNKHIGFGVSPKKYIFSPKLLLKGRKSLFSTKVYGFNLKLYQVKNFLPFNLYPTYRFISDLNNDGWKIVHLRRLNILEQALSFIIATKRNYWHTWQKKEPDNSKMFISYEDLLFHLELNEKITREENKILKDIPHLKIVYEDHLLNSDKHQDTCNKIFKYLGVENHSVKAKSEKILTRNKYEDMIENYHELMGKISKTPYEKYI